MARFKLNPFHEQNERKLEGICNERYLTGKDKKGRKDWCYWNELTTFFDKNGNSIDVASPDEQDNLIKKGLVKLTNGKYIPFDTIDEVGGQRTETSGEQCFIATTVYGNPQAPQVATLRSYRDNVLKQKPFGKAIVGCYYGGTGRKTADFIKNKIPFTIPIIRKGLDFLVEKYNAKMT